MFSNFIQPFTIPGSGGIDFSGIGRPIPEDFGLNVKSGPGYTAIEIAEGSNMGAGWDMLLPGLGKSLDFNTASSSINGQPYGGSNPKIQSSNLSNDMLRMILIFIAAVIGIKLLLD